ncbi:MAG TPA: phytoene/squalene synthase family protein [Pseudonocardia sp.]|nr:phytoene/squalene synthase family protein [Pseudonocardia sp.]
MADASARELDAAGITAAALRAAYSSCRALNAHHGRTYFLATRLLAPAQRPYVHALYGFARHADEIVDAVTVSRPAGERARELDELAAELRAAILAPDSADGPDDPPGSTSPVVTAVAHTSRRHRLDPAHFDAFLDSMRMDTEVTDYPTYADLERYMYGSAAVIGLQMLPVLGTSVPGEDAEPAAAALGVAFQLTNFLRDVGEDLDRGRVYLPADELAAFGVDRELLRWCRVGGRRDSRVRRALAHLVARNRAVYRRAAPGIGQLAPQSRPCVRTAYALYSGILDRIVAADYHVLTARATVPTRRRLAVAVPELARAYAARTGSPSIGRPSIRRPGSERRDQNAMA